MTRAHLNYSEVREHRTFDGEEWRVIAEARDYAVSSLGHVKRIVAGRQSPAGYILQGADRRGYRVVNLSTAHGEWVVGVNRLVALAFHGTPPSPEHHAAHSDGNSRNDRADNIRWATPAENVADKVVHGTMLRGEACAYAKLDEAAVREIRAAPKRNGECQRLADKFGVSKNHIAKVRTKSRGIWPDVPFPDAAK